MLARISDSSPRATTGSSPAPHLSYLPALDGLRALAVLAVLAYHADLLWMPGGFLGVEIFFVVSGYLITSLLLAEYRASGRILLKQFWQRRARRLLPALFTLLIAVLTYALFFLPTEVASLRADALAAFAYITNWYLILSQQSYFQAMGRPSLLRHLWSLAVEEQFYLLWPLVFAFVLTRLRTRATLWLLLSAAAISALWMGFLYVPDADPSRVYYGTDTRAAGLLIGAALAFVWMPHTTPSPTERSRKWLLELGGIAALAGLAAAVLLLGEFDPLLYQGGMLLVSAATALVIAAVVHPGSPLLAPVLGFDLLKWIGQRSYSLYLWHWPVFMLTRPQLDVTLEGTPLLALRFAATFALAELSYRIVETPIRHGALGRAWDSFKRSDSAARGFRRVTFGFATTAAVVLLLAGGLALGQAVAIAQPAPVPDYLLNPDDEAASAALMTDPADPSIAVDNQPVSSSLSPVSFVLEDPGPAATSAENPVAGPADTWVIRFASQNTPLWLSAVARPERRLWPLPRPALSDTALCGAICEARQQRQAIQPGAQHPPPLPRRSVLVTPSSVVNTVPANPLVSQPGSPAQVAASPNQLPILPSTGPIHAFAIGDSVMLGASRYLSRTIGAVDVDAKVGRQVSAAIRILQSRKDANALPSIILVHLGNNGTFSAGQLDQMMRLLGPNRFVVFINTKVPRAWQAPNNAALLEGVKRYPNAALVDWNAISSGHPEWFWQDGIHLRPEGAQVYANLIASTVAARN